MKRFRKYTLQVAAAAILAMVLTLAAPRAVHAVTAALVNVTNTAASPAIGQGVDRLASQNVFLTGVAFPSGIATVSRQLPDGSKTAFVVPGGQSLIVTSVTLNPSNSSGVYTLSILSGLSSLQREFWMIPGVYTAEFQFPSGIVFGAGDSVSFDNFSSSPGAVVISLHGYLTSN